MPTPRSSRYQNCSYSHLAAYKQQHEIDIFTISEANPSPHHRRTTEIPPYKQFSLPEAIQTATGLSNSIEHIKILSIYITCSKAKKFKIYEF